MDGGVSLAGVLGALGAGTAVLAAGAWLGRLMVRRQAETWSSGIRDRKSVV